MSNANLAITALGNRVWYLEGGVHPNTAPQLLTLGKVSTDPTQSIGEATKISAPDPNNFERDISIGSVPGERERATISIGVRYTVQKAILADWKNKGCRVDIIVVSGKCGNPQDFTEGGDKMTYFPDGQISSHSYENYGAFGRDENNPTNEMVDMTADDYWEWLNMGQEVIGSAETVRELWTVDVYKGDNCENCPDPCARVLMTMAGAAATPGTKPSLLYSDDSGETFTSDTIDTLFSNEIVKDAEIVGGLLVLISNTSNSMHWIDIEDLYNGTGTWMEVITGFVAAHEPLAMSSADVRHTWIVGNGGYVYFASNVKNEVTVQDAGVATTQHLNGVHAMDTKNVLAVGNSNAVIYTKNGGLTWASVTGPAVGINLECCWMWSETVWFVGEGAGGTGKLWLTVNSGKTWTQKTLPATYVMIDQIKFVSEAEGFISARTAGQSFVLRTKTAGYEWVVLPEGKNATALDNTYLPDLAVCSKYANTAYAVGLADNGTAGVAYRFSGE